MEEIKPTIGRIVLFNNNGTIRPAIVIGVYGDGLVDLNVFTGGGVVVLTSVYRALKGEPMDDRQWDWMPFQKDQQARLAKEAAATPDPNADVEAVEPNTTEEEVPVAVKVEEPTDAPSDDQGAVKGAEAPVALNPAE